MLQEHQERLRELQDALLARRAILQSAKADAAAAQRIKAAERAADGIEGDLSHERTEKLTTVLQQLAEAYDVVAYNHRAVARTCPGDGYDRAHWNWAAAWVEARAAGIRFAADHQSRENRLEEDTAPRSSRLSPTAARSRPFTSELLLRQSGEAYRALVAEVERKRPLLVAELIRRGIPEENAEGLAVVFDARYGPLTVGTA